MCMCAAAAAGPSPAARSGALATASAGTSAATPATQSVQQWQLAARLLEINGEVRCMHRGSSRVRRGAVHTCSSTHGVGAVPCSR